MEQTGGLSTKLRQSITNTKVAIIGSVALELIAEAVRRLGFINVETVYDSSTLPLCDIVICICHEKRDCKTIINHYNNIGVPVICVFNFGIGACAVILPPNKELPHFVGNKADNDIVKAMLEYTNGYSKFWNISRNCWVEDALQWIYTPEVSTSIGAYTMTAMAAHLLVAIVARNKVKTYPKFYLSTIANDIY